MVNGATPAGIVLIIGGVAFAALCAFLRTSAAGLRQLERQDHWLRDRLRLASIPHEAYVARVRLTFGFLAILGLFVGLLGMTVLVRG